MNPIFEKIIQALPQGENRQMLIWESFWYSNNAIPDNRATGGRRVGGQHDTDLAADVKREALPLVLSSTTEEIALVTQALRGTDAELAIKEGEISIRLAAAQRQPESITFAAKKFTWLPAGVSAASDQVHLPADCTLKAALSVAMLFARYPQLVLVGSQAVSAAGFGELSQSFRRRIFRNLILGRRPSAGLRFLDALGLLDHILPEVTAGRGLSQNRFHAYDIFEHLLRSIDGAMDLNEAVRWSALLHDVGKVPTRVEGENGEASFHNHEMYSARMVVPIMKRCAVPIGIGQKVKFLVRNHMFHYTDEWSDKAVRRFVKKVPLEEMQDLISLRLADRKGSGKKTAFPKALQKLISHIDDIIAQEKEFKIKDLAIDGHTLMEMGMQPSREMGDMLKYLFEEVKSGRAENAAEALKVLVLKRRAESESVL